jgi:hypothetical protein
MAAFLAIIFRLRGERLAARAWPPLEPPRLPNAAAARLISSGIVLSLSIFMLERKGI